MSARYIAILGNATPLDRARLRHIETLPHVVETSGLILSYEQKDDAAPFTDGRGIAIGKLFSRCDNVPLRSLGRDVTGSGGDASDTGSLCRAAWGAYVAFDLDGPGRVSVIRDPSGATACYLFTRGETLVVTSTLRSCVEAGLLRPAIDWEAVIRHLAWPERRTARTCLAGVSELMPGERLCFAGGVASTDPIWSPWAFTSAAKQIDTRAEAVALVRRTTQDTIEAWAKVYPTPLVSLSGGLDSSIIMAGAGPGAAAVTLVTDDPLGDERAYAAAVAERCGAPLIERRLDPDRIRPTVSHAASLPRPVSRLFGQEIDRIWREAATETHAGALFHGGGGDNVFCYLASSTPYLDRLLVQGPGSGSASTLEALSRITKVSTWRIRRAALRKALVDRGRYRWPRDLRLLAPQAIEIARHGDDHPWFETVPARTLPGKQAHVAALVRIQNHLDSAEPERRVPVIAPLMSQPVIEACLRVPSWMWCEGGINRSVARDAWQDRLPASVVDRRGKGSPAAFDAHILVAHRATVRHLLLDGELVRQGLIDRDVVATALDAPALLRGEVYLRLSELVDVEAWVQSWIGTVGAPGVAQA